MSLDKGKPAEESASAGEWKRMPELDRLVIVKTLRPERLTEALSKFVAAAIGQGYITSQPFSLERSFQVSSILCLPTNLRTAARGTITSVRQTDLGKREMHCACRDSATSEFWLECASMSC